jgi:hypothetical protein
LCDAHHSPGAPGDSDESRCRETFVSGLPKASTHAGMIRLAYFVNFVGSLYSFVISSGNAEIALSLS